MGGWIALIIVGLSILGYAFLGIGWLFTHQLPYVILALVLITSALIAYFVRKSSVRNAKVTHRIAVAEDYAKRGSRAVRTLIEDRPVAQRQASELAQLRRDVRGDIGFQLLAQRHHESRLLADSWYTHKAEAIGSRKEITNELSSFRTFARSLGRAAKTEEVIVHLSSTTNILNDEIERSAAVLDQHNIQTGLLRDHIRDNCGERGRRWYNDLEERKRLRSS
jgi:hypothetical protein